MSDANFLPDDLPLMPGEEALALLSGYLDMLAAWNRALNLVGCGDGKTITSNLIGDSFHLAYFLDGILHDKAAPQIADLGAGAGLPGIPLRMVWQKGSYAMVEIREKRALFLANVLSRLKLPRTRIFREDAKKFLAANAGLDCVLSRAFKPWPEILKMCAPYLAPDGLVVIMANQPPPDSADGWETAAAYPYRAGDKSRWFWAMSAQKNGK